MGMKLQKIMLDGGFTCPNRDGTLGSRGCIFCSAGGSGDFAVSIRGKSIQDQLAEGLALFQAKTVGSHLIAYFQAYTNTYAPADYLRELFSSAILHLP